MPADGMTLTAALFLPVPPVGMERLTRIYLPEYLTPGGGFNGSYRGRRGKEAREVRYTIALARSRVKRRHRG